MELTYLQIANHKLTDVKFIPSPNTGGNITPDAIIIHYTAGASASSSIKSLCNPSSKASAHIVVAKDGTITQLVPFNVKAWHAGKSEYNGRKNYNDFSIGIEIDNAGQLKLSNGKYTSWFNTEYDEADVYTHTEGNKQTYWHKYTIEQVEAIKNVCRALMNEYCINELLGHNEIAPTRKIDPGKAFDMYWLRNHLGFNSPNTYK
jgi:N-acetylmuramoyl-L-alanine amidase